MKTCTKCHESKPLDAFRRGQGYKDGIRSECKACQYARLCAWRATHPEARQIHDARSNAKRREKGTGYYTVDPDLRELFALQRRDAYLRRKYGITLDEYVALRELQHGVCATCQRPPSAVGGVGSHPELVVDHDHATGMVRGLLCDACNVALGRVGDKPEVLRRLAEYIEASRIVTES